MARDLELAPGLDPSLWEPWAEALPAAFETAEVFARSNERALKVLPHPDGEGRVVLKHYAPRPARQRRLDETNGTPAQRSWRAARRLQEHGVGTPAPLVWLRTTEGEWLVTEALEQTESFKTRVIRILRETQDCTEFIDLLQGVADTLRGMYAAGVVHGDLGNQNILLSAAEAAHLIDLDRARIGDPPDLKTMARDLSRIHLPSEFRRVLYEMIFEGRQPKEFKQHHKRYLRRFAWHTRSHAWRHPIRERRRARENRARTDTYPPASDYWIYDEKSMQAITCLRSRDRLGHVRIGDAVRAGWHILREAPGVWRAWKTIQPEIFRDPVDMAGRFACALEPTPERWPHERALIMDLPRFPVWVRFYHHKGMEGARPVAEAVRELHDAGFPVSVALVQCRRSVTDPESWATFCSEALALVRGSIEQVEVGHATMRVKWGCWNGADYGTLAAVVPRLRQENPDTEFVGPAGIDFEYHRIVETLAACGRDVQFDALSHHLYVDRRGAPEAEQHGFDTARKCALARALARANRRTDDRFVVSEVNWPIMDTGVWSPTASPYLFPGQRKKSGTDEATYPHYLVRFALQSVCSGMTERIVWWTLGAHGFGLVDPLDDWRPRPAYHAFARWLSLMQDARFLRHEKEGSLQRFVFEREKGPGFDIVYAYPDESPADLSGYASLETFTGTSPTPSTTFLLTGEPLIAEHAS